MAKKDYDRKLHRAGHFVRFTWPKNSRMANAWGQKAAIQIYMRSTGGWGRDEKVKSFQVETTSYGSLEANEARVFANAMVKAAARCAELNKLYKNKKVIY